MKILFFIESLRGGGKERRLLELVHYLNQNTDFKLLLVLTERDIHYKYVYDLNIRIEILQRKFLKKDPRLFIQFSRLCNEFNPDIIHTWGSMLAIYALPIIKFKNISHINSHIADAPIVVKKNGFNYFSTYLGFKYSTIILSNTYAGLKAYGLSGQNCRVIHNGIRLDRFSDLPDEGLVRARFNIKTTYAIIMVASFSSNKNYDQYLDIAEYLLPLRQDITFLCVGEPLGGTAVYDKSFKRASKLGNVLLFGRTESVESLVNACDIGVLFSYSEGLSNSIMEYMACGKPVIASDTGGTNEIVLHSQTGFLISNETTAEIASLLTDILDNENKRRTLGENARLRIKDYFSVDRMGTEFHKLYLEVASRRYS